MKRWLELTALFLFLAAVLALFFYPAVFQNRLIYSGDFSGSDLLELNVPRRVLAAQAVADGEAPLWEPKLGNGLPLLAEGQAGIFYPTTLPLYLALSATQATNYSLLLALLVAMAGGYAWARAYGVSPGAALLGAVTYGLGGAFVFRLKHLNMVQVIAWLPLSLALIRWYWSQRRFLYLPLLALVWAFQFLAGHPHVTYICWLSCYLYLVALAWEGRGATDPCPIGRLLAKMLMCTAVALALSAVQLLPTCDFAYHSTRGAAKTWADLHQYPFKAEHLSRLVAPFGGGNPAQGACRDNLQSQGVFWESAPFVGIVPLVMGVWALLARRRRSTYALAGLACLLLWAALGAQGGLYWLFWKMLPAFDRFRFPARMLIPFLCFWAILAALGAQQLFETLRQRNWERVGIAVIALLLVLSLGDFYRVNQAYQAYLPASWEARPASLDALPESAQRIYAPCYFYSWSQMAQQGWHNADDRILYHLRTLNPDVAAMWGVSCHSDHVVFEGGMVLEPYFGLQCWESAEIQRGLQQSGKLIMGEDWLEWLRRQGVSHIASFIPALEATNNPLLATTQVLSEPAFPDRPLYVYGIKDPLPLVRLVAPADLTQAVPAPVSFIASAFPDFARVSSYEKGQANQASTGQAVVLSQRRGETVVKTNCSERSCLAFMQTNAAGWSAFLEDGRELPIQALDYAYMMVELEPGEHTVTWRYGSAPFSWGWKISLLTLVLGVGYLIWRGRKRVSDKGTY